jgi:ribosomal protein S12 methylthiotransferase accessory factor
MLELPTDGPASVFLALVLSGDGAAPAAAVGLGCSLRAADAARAALWEAEQVRILLLRQFRDPDRRLRLQQLVADPKAISSIDDHSLLYCSATQVPRLDFLVNAPAKRLDWTPARPRRARQDLDILLQHFAATHQDPLFVDLTSPEIARLRLHAVRVIVPGYQPMHVGAEPRLGGRRLFDMPARLGLRPGRAKPSALNRDPHPLG